MNMRPIALSCALYAVGCGGADSRPVREPPYTSTTSATPAKVIVVDQAAPVATTWTPPRTEVVAPAPTSPSQPAAVHTNPSDADRANDAENTGVNARDRNLGGLTPMDQGNSAAETKITAQIRKGLMSNRTLSFDAKNVRVITVGTKVTLRGPVKTDRERAAIEALARQTPGVTEVDDQLEIKR